jgi:protein-tyrosine phosphatase
VSLSVNPSRLSLDNAVNLRDVGGLPCHGGGSTRHLVLLRSGSLRLLTATDARVLLSVCGVGVVVDLRTARELAEDGPSELARAGVATLHLPLGREERGALPEPVAAVRETYREFLDERGHHIAGLARVVAGSGTATLVHSAAGKDRTGVAVGMLLDAVGVQRSAVIADYVASNEVVEQVVRALTRGTGTADPAAHLARPAVLTELLEEVDDEHGGAAAWLRERGLTDPELAALRRRLVRPPAA